MENLNLDLAKESDLDAVVNIIQDLSRWLKTKGVTQWSGAFPRHILEEEMALGALYVLRENENVIGTVALSREPGLLWDDAPGGALYLQRLALRRDKAGQRLGEAIMNWAELEVKRKGIHCLRLVCDANNPFLPAYYDRLGYESRGTGFYKPWDMTFRKFEKDVR